MIYFRIYFVLDATWQCSAIFQTKGSQILFLFRLALNLYLCNLKNLIIFLIIYYEVETKKDETWLSYNIFEWTYNGSLNQNSVTLL